MKVIREGKVPPEPVYEGTCSHCNCQFECDWYELHGALELEMFWGTLHSKRVKDSIAFCPTCSRSVNMHKKVS